VADRRGYDPAVSVTDVSVDANAGPAGSTRAPVFEPPEPR
jgi:hypothetical protein